MQESGGVVDHSVATADMLPAYRWWKKDEIIGG
jgi:hypothetical protein